MTARRLMSVLFAVAILAACSTPTSQRYNTADVGKSIETSRGEVVTSRIVQISGSDSLIGPAAGGALGGAGAGWGLHSGWAAIIGAVVGAGAGYLAQDAVTSREGIEYIVQMDDGRTVTLVQNRASDETPIADGTPVLVQLGGKYSRIVPDPRARDRAAAAAGSSSWVDPDKVGTGASASGSGGSLASTGGTSGGSSTSTSGSARGDTGSTAGSNSGSSGAEQRMARPPRESSSWGVPPSTQLQ